MRDEPPAVIIVILLLLIVCQIYGCGREGVEKEAISRGYASYDQQGRFEWKEQKNEN